MSDYARRQGWIKNMTEPINKGILTDKEGTGFPGCRITVDGKDTPFTVLNFVQKYLDAIPKQAAVCFTTKEGKITKIWPDKEPGTDKVMSEKAVADLKEKAAQAPDKPLESGIKIVQGQITAFDAGAHTLTIKDIKGVHHDMIWGAPMVERMEKLKQWFFVSISAEKSGEYWKVIDQTYFKKPDDWPVSQRQGYGGKSNYQPRNEKIIVLQSTLKVCAEVFAITTTPDSMDFDMAMDLIIARAIKDTDTLMAAGKVD